jgi:hypothetical protein
MYRRQPAEVLDEAIRNAEPARAAVDSPEPLIIRDVPEPFPLDALGIVLGNAARAIMAKTQCDAAIAGQSVLAGANLAAQDCVDVLMPRGGATPEDGVVRPISEYFMVIGTTGTRKSSADRLALASHRAYEKRERIAHAEAMKAYRAEAAAYNAKKRAIETEGKSKKSQAELAEALKALKEPERPRDPQLIFENVTAQGLFKALGQNLPRAGVFSDDGGTFFHGHSMKAESRYDTGAQFCQAWDGKDIQRIRATEEKMVLRNVRLSCFMAIQPSVVADFLHDGQAADQGFTGRWLIAEVPPRVEPRTWLNAGPEADASLAEYDRAITAALQVPRKTDEAGDPDRPVVRLSGEAFECHKSFYNELQAGLGRYGELVDVIGLVEKGHEHACRLAATLAFLEEPNAEEITSDLYQLAARLVRYYIREALRQLFAQVPDSVTVHADKIRVWLEKRYLECGHVEVTLADLTKGGPRPRTKAPISKAMVLLEKKGYVRPVQPDKVWTFNAGRSCR